ncbi:cytidylate kinase, partial [Lacticaseibacillus rhamnosus MTCC 5462]
KRELKRQLATLEAEIAERDRKDSQRKVSPLRQAADAIRIDTTRMTIEEVVAKILALVAEKKQAD